MLLSSNGTVIDGPVYVYLTRCMMLQLTTFLVLLTMLFTCHSAAAAAVDRSAGKYSLTLTPCLYTQHVSTDVTAV